MEARLESALSPAERMAPAEALAWLAEATAAEVTLSRELATLEMAWALCAAEEADSLREARAERVPLAEKLRLAALLAARSSAAMGSPLLRALSEEPCRA